MLLELGERSALVRVNIAFLLVEHLIEGLVDQLQRLTRGYRFSSHVDHPGVSCVDPCGADRGLAAQERR